MIDMQAEETVTLTREQLANLANWLSREAGRSDIDNVQCNELIDILGPVLQACQPWAEQQRREALGWE